MSFARHLIWRVDGSVKIKPDDGEARYPTKRTIFIAAEDFAQAAAIAEAALIDNWSRHPTRAEVTRIEPLLAPPDDLGGRDQLSVHVQADSEPSS